MPDAAGSARQPTTAQRRRALPRSIDHLVLAVRDLDAAGAFYERLGFIVGARNSHPWGTQNRLVQFRGAFLELISVADEALIPPHGEGTFSFGAFVRDYLKEREGFAMVALTSSDAQADAAAFAHGDIGAFAPFSFERIGIGPDGEPRQVAFSLAFARNERAPGAGFFVCQHHRPENFWNEAVQRHPNGAAGIRSIALTSENPTDHHIFVSAFTGQRDLKSSSFGIAATLADGATLDVLGDAAARYQFGDDALAPHGEGDLVGLAVAVTDLAALERHLAQAGVPCRRHGQRVVVPAKAAFGTAIAFTHG